MNHSPAENGDGQTQARVTNTATRWYVSSLVFGMIGFLVLQRIGVMELGLDASVVPLYFVLFFVFEYLVFGDRDDVPRLGFQNTISIVFGSLTLIAVFIMLVL
jgi:hypothetical protein